MPNLNDTLLASSHYSIIEGVVTNLNKAHNDLGLIFEYKFKGDYIELAAKGCGVVGDRRVRYTLFNREIEEMHNDGTLGLHLLNCYSYIITSLVGL